VILSSASALASWFCPRPRPRPRGFVLVLGLVLRSLASINMTAKMILRKAATDTKNISWWRWAEQRLKSIANNYARSDQYSWRSTMCRLNGRTNNREGPTERTTPVVVGIRQLQSVISRVTRRLWRWRTDVTRTDADRSSRRIDNNSTQGRSRVLIWRRLAQWCTQYRHRILLVEPLVSLFD